MKNSIILSIAIFLMALTSCKTDDSTLTAPRVKAINASYQTLQPQVGYSGLSIDIIYGIHYVTGLPLLTIENGLNNQTATHRLKGRTYEDWYEALEALGYDSYKVMSAAHYHNSLMCAKAMPSQSWSTLTKERRAALYKSLETERRLTSGELIEW